MRRLILACMASGLVLSAGCEWEGYETEDTWTGSSYGWVNFTGMYRAPGGGMLVIDPAYSPGGTTGGQTNVVTYLEPRELLTIANGSNTTYEGRFQFQGHGGEADTVPGTVNITAAEAYNFTDDNGDGVLEGSVPGTGGTIEYETGHWFLDFGGVAIDRLAQIIARYRYTLSTNQGGGGGDGETPSEIQGNSGDPIYTMLIQQLGERLHIVDSQGYEYNGRILAVSSTSGAGQDTATGLITATFEAFGTLSRSTVVIRGTLLAEYLRTTFTTGGGTGTGGAGGPVGPGTGTATDSYQLLGRTLRGTWFEGPPYYVGDINGLADGVAAPVTTTP